MRKLMDDRDQTIAVLACKICLVSGSAPEKEAAVRRLVDLSRDVNSMLRDEIEACLRSQPDAVQERRGCPVWGNASGAPHYRSR